MTSLYDKLSEERTLQQQQGTLPDWMTTVGYQLLKDKYLFENETYQQRIDTIAKTASKYMKDNYTWYLKFYDILWNGFLSPSTPILANMGREKGCPISCASNYVEDSVPGFYDSLKESALLTKEGFGTSSYLGDIRPRGSLIHNMKGSASGILPVFQDHVLMSRKISQGSQRRGAWAGYIPIDHGDFTEVLNFISKEPDDANVGWCVSNDFIRRLNNGDSEALDRYQRALKTKMVLGKGYFFFPDKNDDLAPQWFKDKGLKIRGSNLCIETTPTSDKDNTYTCVLSSLNVSKYDLWKESDTIFNSTVFLHCVAMNFIDIAKNIKGLEKAVNYTKNYRSLGLGTLGYSTYLQDKMIPFESLDAHYFNVSLFKEIDYQTSRASTWLVREFGEAPIAYEYNRANALRIAIAPNLSSALLAGGVSQGIEPIYKNVYVQATPAGKINRVNPSLLNIMKKRGVYNDKTTASIIKNNGSVKHVDWLSDEEKDVFKTAFEINQKAIIISAAARQKYIDQGQSINLFFSADESEEYISEVHKEAFLNKYIKGLYYIRSETGIPISDRECVACEG